MKRLFILLFAFNVYSSHAQQADTSISDAQKIYGLSRFWQEANYNYAYFSNVPNLNWDSAYQALFLRCWPLKMYLSITGYYKNSAHY